MKTFIRFSAIVAIFTLAFTGPGSNSKACTRVVYIGDGTDNVITGRTLDWKTDIPSNLYVYPQGIERVSYDSTACMTWRSQYGCVVNVGYDLGATEGMNQNGLVVNLLYLPGTSYDLPEGVKDTRLPMSASLWCQYVLDNFGTTDEAVQSLSKDQFKIIAPAMPGGSATTVHMAISDRSGNSAIIEYLDGKLSIHEGKQYQVLTNAPPYDQQLAISKYWEAVGGLNMLPGTNRSQDRFSRASFYIGCIPKNASHEMAIAGVFGVIFNCSVPVGISVPDQPEISSTRWRSVSDQKKLVYYYGTTLNPSIMWVNLNEFDLNPGAPIMKLDILNQTKPYIGNVIKDMKRSNGYKPMFRALANNTTD